MKFYSIEMPPKRRTKKAAYGVKRYNTSNRGTGRRYMTRSYKRRTLGGYFVPAGYGVPYREPDEMDIAGPYSRAGVGYARRISPITNDYYSHQMALDFERARTQPKPNRYILQQAKRRRREIEQDGW